MANLSGQNPALAVTQQFPRRHDPVDDLLKIGVFSAAAESANGTGIAFKAEKVGPYHAVICHNGYTATENNFWTLEVTGADNSAYDDEVVLASIVLPGGTEPAKQYLALEGAAVASLMAAADEGEAIYVRAKAVRAASAPPLTAQVYLTCD